MRLCPCCKEYGDVSEVVFPSLNNRRGVMCFSATRCGIQFLMTPILYIPNYEALMKEHSVAPDWTQITKVQRVLPAPPDISCAKAGWPGLRLCEGPDEFGV